jgi:hypothetical protein
VFGAEIGDVMTPPDEFGNQRQRRIDMSMCGDIEKQRCWHSFPFDGLLIDVLIIGGNAAGLQIK